MRFLVLGHVTIDKNRNKKISYTSAGGPPVFISKILKQLPDTFTTVVAPYGQEFLVLKDNLLLFPTSPLFAKNLVFFNWFKDGKREQRVMNVKSAKPVPIDNSLLKLVKEAQVLLVTPLLPTYSPGYLKKIMKGFLGKFKVLLAQGYFRQLDKGKVKLRDFQEAPVILPLFDVMIVSEEDHPQIFKLAQKWVQTSKLIVIITLAEKGAMVIKKNYQKVIPTLAIPQEKIIDAIGSGDIFSASFAYAFFKKKDLLLAVKFAHQVARQCLFFTPDKLDQALSGFKFNF